MIDGLKPLKPSFAPSSISTNSGLCCAKRLGKRASPFPDVSPEMLALITDIG